MNPGNILINDFNYNLPPDRIALFPLPERDGSRLLVYKDGYFTDKQFLDLAEELPPGSTLVLNDTRVIEARILFKKPTGGHIEIFCLNPHLQSIESSLAQKDSTAWECLIGGASKWKPGQLLQKELIIGQEQVLLTAQFIQKLTDSFVVSFSWTPGNYSFSEIIHVAGAIPLPPYLKREATAEDPIRYQTIFSRHEGSVAAPTAALHFTPRIMEKLVTKNISSTRITLHVGAGTFKPVKSSTIAGHEMHSEPFIVSKDALIQLMQAGKIIAVGTTSLRTLESLYWFSIKLANGLLNDTWELKQWEAYELEKYPSLTTTESLEVLINWMNENGVETIEAFTSLIIVPGYQFHYLEGLITNFHQPQSTLLLLVSAFIGEDWKRLYQHALNNNYRFLSYGDSSLLWRK